MFLSKKAQFDIMTIGIILIFIFIIAPIAYKMTTMTTTKFAESINPISNMSANRVAYIEGRFTNWWDTGMVMLIVGNIILLIISAFLITVHPAFILVFILLSMFSMIFIPQLLVAPEKVWSSEAISSVTTHLPMTQFIMEHFGIILLGIIIITGIVLYSKIMQNRSYG